MQQQAGHLILFCHLIFARDLPKQCCETRGLAEIGRASSAECHALFSNGANGGIADLMAGETLMADLKAHIVQQQMQIQKMPHTEEKPPEQGSYNN